MSAAVKVCVGYVVGGEPLNLADGEYQLTAIAPPVAAGSVDIEQVLRGIDQDETESDGGWWETSDGANVGKKKKAEILAWGMQQREAGRQEGYADGRGMANEIVAAIDKATQVRAEKAEAELKQVNEWRAAALSSNQQMQELMAAKLNAAEARIKQLENFTAPHPDTKLMDFLTSRASINFDEENCLLRFEVPSTFEGANCLRDIVRTAMESDDG